MKEDAHAQLVLTESDNATSTSESQTPVHSETPEQQKALAESQKVSDEAGEAIKDAVAKSVDKDKGSLDQAKSFLNTLG